MRKIALTRLGLMIMIAILLCGYADAAELRVLKMGLGEGTVTSDIAGIDCGTGVSDCEFVYGDVNVTLTPNEVGGSNFVRWDGDCQGVGSGLSQTCTVRTNALRLVRAKFDPPAAINPLSNCASGTTAPDHCSATYIENYLNNPLNSDVDTPAEFIAALPQEYRQNWILMTRSESLQTGTAQFPRILLPSADGRYVFSIGTKEHSAYPSSHPNAIEYMQWDPDSTQKTFRFHEIVLNTIPAMNGLPQRTRGVEEDDRKCTKCHSTQNVLNTSAAFGTTGTTIPPSTVKAKSKPNWDTYDSWAGMLPFNRDRVYKGSVEAAALRKLLNFWTWKDEEVARLAVEQLQLPNTPGHSIERLSRPGETDSHIRLQFDPAATANDNSLVTTEPAITDSNNIMTDYAFDATGGNGSDSTVKRESTFFILHNPTNNPPSNGEGRGVDLFDLLTGQNLNPTRVADELINHRYATGSFAVDVRPLALAIATGCVKMDLPSSTVSTTSATGLAVDWEFFNARHGINTASPNSNDIAELLSDTRKRQQDFPRRKADLQRTNLDRKFPGPVTDPYLATAENGLIQAYGVNATSVGSNPTFPVLRQEVFRRITVPNSTGVTAPDRTTELGGIYVDREDYYSGGSSTTPENAEKMTLYRYFLEPLGVSVDKWSTAVRGRSRTYTFADLFFGYTAAISSNLTTSISNDPRSTGIVAPVSCDKLVTSINANFSAAALPSKDQKPTYTDIQRIFNKSCIECHGGLNYPPYSNYSSILNLSEREREPTDPPQTGWDRMDDPHGQAESRSLGGLAGSSLYDRITRTSEACPGGMMPCGGPPLSQVDIQTIRRWIDGTPVAPRTAGDPHIRTVEGINYDFQAAGEFILLDSPSFEVQARHVAVETTAPYGPNAYTGLTSCVSVNGAVAVRVDQQRVTYQPNINGVPNPDGLQLRIDGKVWTLGPQGIPLVKGGRIIQTSVQGGVQIESSGGAKVVVTPNWWSSQSLWYMNIDISGVRADMGLMGSIPYGSWLPMLPDGSSVGGKPKTLAQRYHILYNVFGNAWRVTGRDSLFDYAPAISPAYFDVAGWPNGESPQSCNLPPRPNGAYAVARAPVAQPMPRAQAEQHCAAVIDVEQRDNCIGDVAITGEPGFAQVYLQSERITLNQAPTIPELTFPQDNAINVVGPIEFAWNATMDEDGDSIRYHHCLWNSQEEWNNHQCRLLAAPTFTSDVEIFTCAWWLMVLIGLLLVLLLLVICNKQTRLFACLAVILLIIIVILYYCCDKGGTGPTRQSVEDLKLGQTYYWRVIAEDGQGNRAYSKVYRFETKE